MLQFTLIGNKTFSHNVGSQREGTRLLHLFGIYDTKVSTILSLVFLSWLNFYFLG